ncbi:HTH-type transcriptional repressor Bm3R1 [Actinomadura rubteroloni]|uniref:HTH-type transcriptional repressor Bm3R1 n=1 Tax=Actinomadura rubteroloni TaxID=1926885 RepID=A0A2P4URN1_9ACTN|nr:TetR/AcrR family transcriptional regulator [Actinomadura rubteroloni]POM27699.1 HTH-type transcriptional repressor Bm3R1 [Actinomadura rubteroloni]
MVTADARPLRRDAARNLERVVAAARELFAEQGLDASVESIAARAGVGMGTVYRRFPTKEALIEFLVAQVVRDSLGLARRALDERDGTGLASLLRGMGELQAAHRGCLRRLWAGLPSAERREFRSIVRELLVRAQDAGTVRPDLADGDALVLFWSLRHIVELTVGVDPDAWRRHLDVLLAGIAPSDRPLAHRPPTHAELDEIQARHSAR